ncbi:MAG TPA: DUF4209 domain-containing protein [Mucilaginibacter sp.]|jgi:hypothetical protein
MKILEALEPLDNLEKKGIDEREISNALRQLIPENPEEVFIELKAELIAFDFAENYRSEKTGWGTYFGPMFVMNNGDGTATESPSISLVDATMIDYWEERASDAVNPILKARYSGLVWDFKHKITGISPSHEIAKIYIRALIDTAAGDYHRYPTATFGKLKRALTLAIAINHEELIRQAKNGIIGYENGHAKDDKPGLWGYSFDLLVNNKKVNLSNEEEQQIVGELENKLARLTATDSSDQKINPWAAEAAAERLGNYYRKAGDSENSRRVILSIGDAFQKILDEGSAMQVSGWLDHLFKLYNKFNLKEEAAEILLKIREVGPKAAQELKPVTHEFNLPKDEFEQYIKEMTDGEKEDILFKIATQYLPNKEEVKKEIFKLRNSAPFVFLISQQLQDEKGRVVATVGSLDDDLDGHIVRQVSQNLSFSAPFLRSVIQRAIDARGLSKDDILKFIQKSPVVDENRYPIIERAINAYFDKDYMVFVHLAIPQIEEAVRNIVEMAGGNVLKTARGGGYHLRTFDDILRDDIIKEALGEDFADYYKMLFTDQRGWNLRNNVCHGMTRPRNFNNQTSDRVLHALLCLTLLEIKPK